MFTLCLAWWYGDTVQVQIACTLYHTQDQTATFRYGWFISLSMAERRPKHVANGTECDRLWSLGSPAAVLSISAIFLSSAELSAKDEVAVYFKAKGWNAIAGQMTLSELRSGAYTCIDAGLPMRCQLNVRLRTGICGFLLCLTRQTRKVFVNTYLCLLTAPCFYNKVSSSGSCCNAKVTASWMQSAAHVAVTLKCRTILSSYLMHVCLITVVA